MAEGNLTIVGQCKEMSVKSGWTAFAITIPGKQYPLKLSTKLEALIAAAQAVGEQNAIWTYSESEGGPNPNKPGQNYINRRLEGVELASAEQVAAAASASPTNGGASRGDGARDASIERQVIIKALMPLYPLTLITSDQEFWALAARADAFVAGISYGGRGGPPATAGDQPPPDDDIPF